MSAFSKDQQPLGDKEALARHIKHALAVEMPRGLELELSYQLMKRLFKPMVLGAENIPEQPCLFVGNHSLFALDGWVIGPLFVKELHRFPRGLGDRFLFANSWVADFILKRGGVLGHPDVCAALMEAGQDLLNSALGELFKRLGLLTADIRSDILPPIPVGALGTPLPKPQRCYLGFDEPIDLSEYKGRTPTRKQQRAIRDEVAQQIETQLTELLFAREQHRGDDSLLRRLLCV